MWIHNTWVFVVVICSSSSDYTGNQKSPYLCFAWSLECFWIKYAAMSPLDPATLFRICYYTSQEDRHNDSRTCSLAFSPLLVFSTSLNQYFWFVRFGVRLKRLDPWHYRHYFKHARTVLSRFPLFRKHPVEIRFTDISNSLVYWRTCCSINAGNPSRPVPDAWPINK